ncbi:uncharacterized protein CDAR_467521 [Caerostris darwini]|uniref:Uncharacterized protein n=1 Tax=Caerostris darwini TaxID=1538125 RepID=A0AAV4RT13_9ARAC|nr:uncharacterized protein CDAR_467521 [Caerostris darwini]
MYDSSVAWAISSRKSNSSQVFCTTKCLLELQGLFMKLGTQNQGFKLIFVAYFTKPHKKNQGYIRLMTKTNIPVVKIIFKVRLACNSNEEFHHPDKKRIRYAPDQVRKRQIALTYLFHESPPEPAPTSMLPGRIVQPGLHMDGLGRRPRLGYLESECESEPPYLPTMLTTGMSSIYPSQGKSLQ